MAKAETAFRVLKAFNSDRPHERGDGLSSADVSGWRNLHRLISSGFLCRVDDFDAIQSDRNSRGGQRVGQRVGEAR